jgi:UDP-N-acetyl-D-glucosamine dehydrogenase
MKKLRSLLISREARVGVIGLGYVGLPLSLAFARRGFSVTGFDVSKKVVASLARGRSHIPDVPNAALRKEIAGRRFRSSYRFTGLKKCDVIIICVPTPLRKSREPDVSYIQRACEAVLPNLRKEQLIVLESTTYPGTTREMVAPILEKSGLRLGKDFHLAFSPERVDPSNKTYGIENTPKVVGGMTRACTDSAALLYGQVVDEVVPVSDADTAEMAKLLENTFRAVNIGLVNEMALMCNRLGLDVWEVVGAAATKPFGFMPFYPGPGLGGHCIPVDPGFLAWKMKTLNFEPRFIELAEATNASMPAYTVGRVAELLNGAGKPVKGARVFVLGVAYKPDVNDVRESPALDVMTLLMSKGAKVTYHDPYVSSVKVAGKTMRSVKLTAGALKKSDITVILTAHRAVELGPVVKQARVVFDARNATSGMRRRNVHRL